MDVESRIRQVEERVSRLENEVRHLLDFLRDLQKMLSFEPCPYRTFSIFVDKERDGSIVIRIVPFCTVTKTTCNYPKKSMCRILQGK